MTEGVIETAGIMTQELVTTTPAAIMAIEIPIETTGNVIEVQGIVPMTVVTVIENVDHPVLRLLEVIMKSQEAKNNILS